MWKAGMLMGVALITRACAPSAPQQPSAAVPPAGVDLAMTSAFAPLPMAPQATALPPAAAIRYAPVSQPAQSYQYIDDAYAMSDAFNDAPPDYAVDYGGAQPWVWRALDGAYRIYEATSDGGRYYYYRPGQTEPYLVRDPNYAYAYQDGELVTVYDTRGRILPLRDARQRTDWAGRYLSRARLLQTAAAHERRVPVSAPVWVTQRTTIVRTRDSWADDRRKVREWQTWHDRHEADERQHWADEARRRQQAARDFDQWHARGFQGEPSHVIRAAAQSSYRADERHNMDAQRQAERQRLQAEQRRQQQIAQADRARKAAQDRHREQLAQAQRQRQQAQHEHKAAAHPAQNHRNRPEHVTPPKVQANKPDQRRPAQRHDGGHASASSHRDSHRPR